MKPHWGWYEPIDLIGNDRDVLFCGMTFCFTQGRLKRKPTRGWSNSLSCSHSSVNDEIFHRIYLDMFGTLRFSGTMKYS